MFIDLTNSLAAHFAKRNTKFGGGGKRGRARRDLYTDSAS